jgi:hypothetical protein
MDEGAAEDTQDAQGEQGATGRSKSRQNRAPPEFRNAPR